MDKASIKESLFKTAKRFPIPILFAIIAWIWFSGVVVDIIDPDKKIFGLHIGVIMISSVTFFFTSVACKLFFESRKILSDNVYLHSIVTIAICLLCFIVTNFIIDSLYAQIIAIILFTFASFLAIFIAPFLFNLSDRAQFSSFSCELVGHIAFAVFASIILQVGNWAIFAAIKLLFNIEVIIYEAAQIFAVFIPTIFAPLYVLSRMPSNYLEHKNEAQFPKSLAFLANYILAPLTLIYALILSLYVIKVIILWKLPENEIGYLISIFGMLGSAAYFITQPLNERASKFALLMNKYFYFLLLPPVILLSIAAMIRINEYGLTVPRYLLIAYAGWLGFCCLYIIFSKAKNLKYVVSSLVIACIIASYGPFSAVNLSANAQYNRLEHILKDNNILADGKFQQQDELNAVDYNNAKSILEYLIRYEQEDKIAHWFAGSDIKLDEIIADDNDDRKSYKNKEYANILISKIAIKNNEKSEQVYKNYRIVKPASVDFTGVRVAGYDYLVNHRLWCSHRKASCAKTVNIDNVEMSFEIDGGLFKAKLTDKIDGNNNLNIELPLYSYTKQFLQDNNIKINSNVAYTHRARINLTNEQYQEYIINNDNYSLLIREINLDIKKEQINDVNFILLLKNP